MEGNNDPLSGLKDIFVPSEISVSVFPIAYGFYIVIGFIVASFLLYKLYSNYKLVSVRYYCLRQLKSLRLEYEADKSLKTYGEEVSKLLKRYAILKFGNVKVANLYGNAWAEFLKNNAKKSPSYEILEIITNAPYLPDMRGGFDITRIEDFVKSFIKR
ncbi:MAG: hypothetical protein BWY78_01300 [Alphaproteobacteria bacterium ADurb.Bin438]|nr:MAG: hypothetical protein BWY78_01300 [Alphaproteobacteria bacterium ADurb.Bin438]